jgi:hypothetical protein
MAAEDERTAGAAGSATPATARKKQKAEGVGDRNSDPRNGTLVVETMSWPSVSSHLISSHPIPGRTSQTQGGHPREEMRGDGMRWDGVGWDGMREGVSTSSCVSTCRMGWDEMRARAREVVRVVESTGSASESPRVQHTRHRHTTHRVKSSQRSTSARVSVM